MTDAQGLLLRLWDLASSQRPYNKRDWIALYEYLSVLERSHSWSATNRADRAALDAAREQLAATLRRYA